LERVAFRDCPFVVRIMTCVSMFMIWVLFAEFVIDRYGWHEVIPFYRFGDICPYELLVIVAIVVFWVRAHRRT